MSKTFISTCSWRPAVSRCQVTAGSVASTALATGDLILKVSNIDSVDLTHNEAQDIIKNTHDVLQLTIHKGGLLTPPEPIMSSSQAIPYDSYKSTPNGNIPAMSASSNEYHYYERQAPPKTQSGHGYGGQDGHGYQGQGYQDPNRSASGYGSPASSLSPNRGGYQPPSYETVTNSNYGYSSPVSVDVKPTYQRQSSQDSSGSRGYGRQSSGGSGPMSPNYGMTQSMSSCYSGQSEPSYGRQFSNVSQSTSGTYGRTDTMSPSYGEPSYGRQLSNNSQRRAETRSPSFGRQEYGRQLSNSSQHRTDTMSPTYGERHDSPSYGRQMLNTSQPQSYGFSGSTAQQSSPRSQAPAPWTYGAPLPPAETQPQYSFARQPSREQPQPTESQYGRLPSYEHTPPSETQPQYSYGRQTSREQPAETQPQYGYARQPSWEQPVETQPHFSHASQHDSRPQVPDTSTPQYPSNANYQSCVPQNAYPYSSSSNSPDYSSPYTSQPYSTTQTAPGHDDSLVKQSIRFAPRDNTTFAPTKWQPQSPSPQFIPPPPPPIEQLQRESRHSAPAVPAAPPPPPPPPPPPLPPVGGFKRPTMTATSSIHAQDGTDGPHIPDCVQKQMAKGPGSKSPFTYAAVSKDDLLKFKQKHRRQKKPQVEHELNDSPTKSATVSAGPGSAVISHGQYNSPADAYIGQSSGGIGVQPAKPSQTQEAPKPQRNYQYVPKPASSPSNKEFDPTQSAAYKMIHGITDEKKTFRQRPKPEELEPEFKPLNPEDDLGYEEETFKKFLPSDPSKQSRSFKLLQRYTKDEEEEMSSGKKEASGVYEETHCKAARQTSSTVPSKAFRKLQRAIGADPDEILEEVKQHKPKPCSLQPEEPPRPATVAEYPAPVPAHMAKAPVYDTAHATPPKPESEMSPAELRAWKRQQKRFASGGGDIPDYQPAWQVQAQQQPQWQPPAQPEDQPPARWEPHIQHEAWKVQPTPEWQAKVESLQKKNKLNEWEPPGEKQWKANEPAPAWQAIAHERRKSNEALSQMSQMQPYHSHQSSAPTWQKDVRPKRTDDDDVGGIIEEGFEPKLYRGGNIPSKAFKKLQIATGSFDLNSSGATTKSSRSSRTSSQRSTPSKELMQPHASKPFPERQLSYEEIKANQELKALPNVEAAKQESVVNEAEDQTVTQTQIETLHNIMSDLTAKQRVYLDSVSIDTESREQVDVSTPAPKPTEAKEVVEVSTPAPKYTEAKEDIEVPRPAPKPTEAKKEVELSTPAPKHKEAQPQVTELKESAEKPIQPTELLTEVTGDVRLDFRPSEPPSPLEMPPEEPVKEQQKITAEKHPANVPIESSLSPGEQGLPRKDEEISRVEDVTAKMEEDVLITIPKPTTSELTDEKTPNVAADDSSETKTSSGSKGDDSLTMDVGENNSGEGLSFEGLQPAVTCQVKGYCEDGNSSQKSSTFTRHEVSGNAAGALAMEQVDDMTTDF
ncbi:titin-like isoform X2 [Lineus longissimus]|uniref:titin-like isoform X2 n=1 Tax=Lineus longissimus TaxID=88925 RepID=UPI00315DA5C0